MFYLVCENCGISNEINWFCLTLSKWKSEEKTKNINENKSNSKIVEKNQSTFLSCQNKNRNKIFIFLLGS